MQANSSTTVTINVDASSFAEELTGLMKNGYYLEGFVRFTDVADGGDIVSIPVHWFPWGIPKSSRSRRADLQSYCRW